MKHKNGLWKAWPFGIAILVGLLVLVSPSISQGYIDPGAIIPGTNTYFLQSGATYADWFDLFGTQNTWTTTQIYDPSSTSVDAIQVDMPASTTADALDIRYDGSQRIFANADSDEIELVLTSRDLGNDVAGPHIQIGRNTNATQGSGGYISTFDLGGTQYYLHVDDSGIPRLGTTAPTGSNDTTNPALSAVNVGDVILASDSQADATSGTYYTGLDLSTSGYLDEVIVMRDHTDADVTWSGEHCHIRINIDGGGAQVLDAVNITPFSADDVMVGYDASGTDAFSGRRIILGGARFESTLVVEYMQDSGSGEAMKFVAHYREDQ